ncbi:hypothetical protein H9Q69_003432 [Fusarium xylarioides]|nr:hypothetical protein H9Q70_008942 [Fusarium xylarioides]KAG5781806.1 hypothetical protein H9Q73_004531 [Fusarium xylarioides]KAG5797494.1 hypothetical protein H9Q69_003432 [Fusarium xylarioides]
MADTMLAQQVSVMFAEHAELRKRDAAQKKEIENLQAQSDFHANEAQMLRDLRILYESKLEQKDSEILGLYVLLDKVKVDASICRDDLSEMHKKLKDLQAKYETSQKQLCAGEAKFTRRNLQVSSLICALRRKISTNRISTVALRAAYKVIPSLEQKARCMRILAIARKLPHKTGIEKEMKQCLADAGLLISFDKNGTMVLTRSVAVVKIPADGYKEFDESITIVEKDAMMTDDNTSGQHSQHNVKKDEDVQMSV